MIVRYWARLAIFALVVGLSAGSGTNAQSPPALPEAKANTIGYPTVAAALTALKARKDVAISIRDGWTVITDPPNALAGAPPPPPWIIWSFAPQGGAAYPAAVKRTITKGPDGAYYLDMAVLCEASKEACDDLVRTFEALNDQMKRQLGG